MNVWHQTLTSLQLLEKALQLVLDQLIFLACRPGTAVQLVFNPFSQLVPQLELYSQLQLSLWSDPIAFSVPKSTW